MFIDDVGKTHEYIFMRDKRLIMSKEGKVVTGTWDLLPNGKFLINRIVDEIMLQYDFVDEAIMIMKKSGTNDDPFILLNEVIIKDYNVINYLENFEAKKLGFDLFETLDGRKVNNKNSSTGSFEIGSTIKYNDGTSVNGELKSINKPGLYIKLIFGVIQSKYYKKIYKTNNDFELIIHAKNANKLEVGDEIINKEVLPSNLIRNPFYGIEDCREICIDSKGKITNITWAIDEDSSNILYVLLVLFFLVVGIMVIYESVKSKNSNINHDNYLVVSPTIVEDTIDVEVDTTIPTADTSLVYLENSNYSNINSFDQQVNAKDIFGLNKNRIYDLSSTRYYQNIFDTLRSISINNSYLLDNYVAQAKYILDRKSIVLFMNEEMSMYDFLDDESIRDRVSNVYLVNKNSDDSYKIYLTLFHQ